MSFDGRDEGSASEKVAIAEALINAFEQMGPVEMLRWYRDYFLARLYSADLQNIPNQEAEKIGEMVFLVNSIRLLLFSFEEKDMTNGN